MKPPCISILMAVYNAEKYLEEALNSVLCQTFPSWQLICVDDASTDSSLAILQRYASKDERIEILHKAENEGQAVARNDALRLAKGEYVAMLDADDWLSPDCLEEVVKAFGDGSDCQVEEEGDASDGTQVDCVVLRLLQHFSSGSPIQNAASPEQRDVIYEIPWKEGDTVSGYEAFKASLDWHLHGLYVVRRDIHVAYPYDTSCRLFSDDNTTRLHYLHSRLVRFCKGTYHYRKHAESCTNAMSVARFYYMKANVSMRESLLCEKLPADVLNFYERHRWENYVGQMWLYACNRSSFTADERREIRQMFREIYPTFHRPPSIFRFGLIWFPSYRLFLLEERLYFSLRMLMRRGMAKIDK